MNAFTRRFFKRVRLVLRLRNAEFLVFNFFPFKFKTLVKVLYFMNKIVLLIYPHYFFLSFF